MRCKLRYPICTILFSNLFLFFLILIFFTIELRQLAIITFLSILLGGVLSILLLFIVYYFFQETENLKDVFRRFSDRMERYVNSTDIDIVENLHSLLDSDSIKDSVWIRRFSYAGCILCILIYMFCLICFFQSV